MSHSQSCCLNHKDLCTILHQPYLDLSSKEKKNSTSGILSNKFVKTACAGQLILELRMSIFWRISRIVNIIFLEEVLAVLTLKGSQEAEQFVTDKKALKAINPINLAAKTDAINNKPADTYSNIRGNGIKDED
ncbi:hypothetical protein D8674_026434 [Pyrus ussuriensis x Pyrus communis]|uniref:Uncharacterized protein n=1 Tax=Pyrus ussuriensis x Pyrus communis TaxID=2448454 RepID=A0A5N5IDV7_9ROSA|nr:hypothetical protein D8674_026434 [Pyrus ussuriensis x Pyrus communis]